MHIANQFEIDLIKSLIKEDISKLALQRSKLQKQNPNCDIDFVIQQLSARKSAISKLDNLSDDFEFLMPAKLSIEQASSTKTAKYKSQIYFEKICDLIGKSEHLSFLDITFGMGIDSTAFANYFQTCIGIESNIELYETNQYNLKKKNLNNIELINTNCESIIDEYISKEKKFDLIYCDPARRLEGNKVISLENYTPNIIDLQYKLHKISKYILFKFSPMLDIKDIIKRIKFIDEIRIVSYKNECKEILVFVNLEQNVESEIKFFASHLENDKILSNQIFLEENKIYAHAQIYLYEAHPALMKYHSIFNYIKFDFENISKIAKDTHLYTSDELINDFPGSQYKIEKVIPYSKEKLKEFSLANNIDDRYIIKIRNFKDNIEMIKKKLAIKEGSNFYLFATRLDSEKTILIICRRID